MLGAAHLGLIAPHVGATVAHLVMPWNERRRQQKLDLDLMNNYIARRQLRWLGHVSRTHFDRLLRRMFSSWLPFPRCRGAAKMTYALS